MSAYRKFNMLGIDLGIMAMLEQGKKNPYELNEYYRVVETRGGFKPLHMSFRGDIYPPSGIHM